MVLVKGSFFTCKVIPQRSIFKISINRWFIRTDVHTGILFDLEQDQTGLNHIFSWQWVCISKTDSDTPLDKKKKAKCLINTKV